MLEKGIKFRRKDMLKLHLCIIVCIFFHHQAFATSENISCLVEPTQQLSLGTPVTGVLSQVLVKRGSVVRQGQVLATLESSVEQANVKLSQYKAEQTANLTLTQQKLAFAQQKFERRQVMANEQLMPEQEKNDAEADYKQAEAEHLLAQENRQLAILEYQQQKAQLALRSLRSPIHGVVTEQSAYVGEVVEANSNAKAILKLAQLNPLRVQLILPQRYFGQFRLNQTIELSPEQPMTGKYTAKVKTIDKVLDPASGTFMVFLELPNPNLSIPAGIRCQAKL